MGEGALVLRGESEGQSPSACRNREQVAVSQFLLYGLEQKNIYGFWEPALDLSVPDSSVDPVPDPPSQKDLFERQLELTPGYVRACVKNKLPALPWFLKLVNKVTGELIHVPYECGNWRCDGCRDRYRRMEYVRITNALEGVDPAHVFFVVLSIPPEDRTIGQTYSKLKIVWPRLRKQIGRAFGSYAYVSTIEQHRSGYPHANFIIVCPEMANMGPGKLKRWMKKYAKRAGWGYMVGAERARSKEKVAAYIAKVSVGQVAAEVSKFTQLPWDAPKGHRRLRSSRDFLEPRRTTGEWTGELVTAEKQVLESTLEWFSASQQFEGVKKIAEGLLAQLRTHIFSARVAKDPIVQRIYAFEADVAIAGWDSS